MDRVPREKAVLLPPGTSGPPLSNLALCVFETVSQWSGTCQVGLADWPATIFSAPMWALNSTNKTCDFSSATILQSHVPGGLQDNT